MSYQEAVRRINAFKNDKNAIRLDLSSLGLAKIPKEIEELENERRFMFLLHLNNNEIEDLSLLSNLINVQALFLSHNKIKNIAPLSNLTNLEGVLLANNEISNIEPIKNLAKNIQHLDLSSNLIKDISALKDFKKIKTLSLLNNKIAEISALSELKNLTELYLQHNQIVEIEKLSGLDSLLKLHLHNNQIMKIDTCLALVVLEELSLENNQVVEIKALAQLKQLKKLYLNHNKIKQIDGLGELKENLVVLGLDNNQISDITELGKLENLTNLGLCKNEIKNTTALEKLKNLKHLDLSDNPIKDIICLEGTSLEALGLNATEISNITEINKFENLTVLGLKGNQISDITALRDLKKLEKLDISNNQISDRRAWKTFFAKGQKGKNALFFGGLSENIEKWLDEKAPKGIESLQKLPLLNELWLNGNKISEVDFSEMPNLKKVYLGNNPIESIKTGNNAIEINFESEVESDAMFSFVPQLMEESIKTNKNLQIGTETTHKKIDGVQNSVDTLHSKVNALLVELPKLRQNFKDNLNGLCDKIKEAIGWNDIADTNYAEQLQNEWQGRDNSKLFRVQYCSDDLRCALFLFDAISQKEQDFSLCILLLCRALEAEFVGFFQEFAKSGSFDKNTYQPKKDAHNPKKDDVFYTFLCNVNQSQNQNNSSLGSFKFVFKKISKISPTVTATGSYDYKQIQDYLTSSFDDVPKLLGLLLDKLEDKTTRAINKGIVSFRNDSAHPRVKSNQPLFSKADAEACKDLVFDLLRGWIDARR